MLLRSGYMTDCKIVKKYAEWLEKNINCTPIENEWFEVVLPFLDVSNDLIPIYIKKTGDRIKISDDGLSIMNMELSGLNIKEELDGNHFLNIMANFNAKYEFESDEITMVTNEENLPKKLNDMLQTILCINGLSFKAKDNYKLLFKDLVMDYFVEKKIPYREEKPFGESGMEHNFLKIVPTNEIKYDGYIKATGHSSTSIQTTLFSFIDSAEIIGDAKKLVIINDTEKKPSDRLIGGLNKYEIEHVFWSERESLLDLIRA